MGTLVIETRITAENAFNRDHFWMEGQTVNRLHFTTNLLQCVKPGWVGCKTPKFMALPNYWMNSHSPHSTILYMHLAMLPGVVMVKILKNDF